MRDIRKKSAPTSDPQVIAVREQALKLAVEMMERLVKGLDDFTDEGEAKWKRLQGAIVGMQKLVATVKALPAVEDALEMEEGEAVQGLSEADREIFHSWIRDQWMAKHPAPLTENQDEEVPHVAPELWAIPPPNAP